jgi:hypothetical protein
MVSYTVIGWEGDPNRNIGQQSRQLLDKDRGCAARNWMDGKGTARGTILGQVYQGRTGCKLRADSRLECRPLLAYYGVTPDGSPLFLRNTGIQEIYALDLISALMILLERPAEPTCSFHNCIWAASTLISGNLILSSRGRVPIDPHCPTPRCCRTLPPWSTRACPG